MREIHFEYLFQQLDALGLAEPGANSTADITTCPGTDTCNLGISNSTEISRVLERVINEEYPDKKMWLTIIACFFAIMFIFYDSYQGGRVLGDFFGLLTAIFIGGSAVVIRYSKLTDLLPALLIAKFFTILYNSFV